MRLRLRESWDGLARSPSRTFLVVVGSFVLGTAAHAVVERPLPWSGWAGALGVAAFLFVLAAGAGRRAAVVFAAVACLLLGFWRYDAAFHDSAYVLPEARVAGESFEGTVSAVPKVRISDTVLTVEVDSPPHVPRGRLYVRAPETFEYGDRIAWKCGPSPVRVEGRDGWEDRLLLDGVRWTCGVYDAPEVLERGRGSPVRAVLAGVRAALVRSAVRVLPEPESSFLLGLLIGAKDGLPSELTDAFRDTGTTHILAVSGYNVTQLIGVGVLLLALGSVPRRKSSAVMAGAVVVFACIVGGDASVIRAAIMGCVGILAALYSRRYSGVRALLAAAALMLAVNPLVLRHDVGFQLSFAAVWGLHFLSPNLMSLLPSARPGWLARTAVETASATLATAPIILQAFGRLPAVALLANLLILPLIPWAMVFGALAMAVGAVSPALALVPAVPAAFVMRAVEETALGCARHFPQALEVSVGPLGVALLYFWLFVLSLALSARRKTRLKDP